MAAGSYGRERYFVTVYDDSSSLSIVRLLNFKWEVPKAVGGMIMELEKAWNADVERMRSPNGKE